MPPQVHQDRQAVGRILVVIDDQDPEGSSPGRDAKDRAVVPAHLQDLIGSREACPDFGVSGRTGFPTLSPHDGFSTFMMDALAGSRPGCPPYVSGPQEPE